MGWISVFEDKGKIFQIKFGKTKTQLRSKLLINFKEKLNVNDRFESESDDFFNKVRNGYLEIANRFPDRVRVIDASKPIQNVQDQIAKYLKELVKK